MKKLLKKHALRFVILFALAIFGGIECDEHFQTSFPYITTVLFLLVAFVIYHVIKNGK